MINYDSIDDWAPQLGRALTDAVPEAVRRSVAAASHQFVEDALANMLRLVERGQVIESTLRWITENEVLAHHGSRLTEEDLNSIRADGLQPLVAERRRNRLQRALRQHPSWKEVEGRLDDAIRAHSGTGKSGRREGQVHLTLSRSGLTSGFDHYLTHGSEFDQQVAYDLLGQEGRDLLATDGTPLVVTVAVPGPSALEATHRYFTVEQTIARGDLPNLVSPFLETWAFKLSDTSYQSTQRQLDCGIWYRAVVPANWIRAVEPP
jgi:hypothetical protein